MKKLICFCFFFCFAIAPAFAANQVVEEIVARVNNRIITLTDFQRSTQEVHQEVQQEDPANADKLFQQRQKDVLRDLIDQQLLLEKGADLGITGDTELIKYLDNMRKEMKLDSLDDLEKAAQAQGMNYEDFKQQKRNQIITQQVIGQEVGRRLNLSEADAQKYYDDHKAQLARPEQVRLSEILITSKPEDVDPNFPADDLRAHPAARAKANEALDQIRKGASFDDIAKKYSNGPTAAQGGDLGEFQRGTLNKGLEDKVFAMQAGDVSEVTLTRQGYIILKVTEHQTAGIPSFKEVAPKIQEAVYMEKLQPALRDYLAKLREDAFIIIYSGYVDSGATPNETVPVETKTDEVKAKKLAKKKKKMLLF